MGESRGNPEPQHGPKPMARVFLRRQQDAVVVRRANQLLKLGKQVRTALVVVLKDEHRRHVSSELEAGQQRLPVTVVAAVPETVNTSCTERGKKGVLLRARRP